MKVKDFIEWLQTQDQEAIVEVVVRHESRGYGGDSFTVEPFNVEEHSYYTDMRGNPFVKEDAPHYNRRSLEIGST